MLPKALVVAVTAVALTLARATSNMTRSCDTPEMKGTQLESLRAAAAQASEMQRPGNPRVAAISDSPKANVTVYVHVVAGGTTFDEGWVSQRQIDLQLSTLNADFSPSGITFTLAAIDYTINRTWTQDLHPLEMKRALRKGTYQDLNLYYIRNFQSPSLGGYCYYPTPHITPYSHTWYQDGCTIAHDVIAGTPFFEYNMGRMTVHEVGHWFGLPHPFEGGCSEPNDGIADTPAEAGPAFGCPVGRDSCPGMEGVDLVGNHMDYTWDRCKDGFTPMQQFVMGLNWEVARKGK